MCIFISIIHILVKLTVGWSEFTGDKNIEGEDGIF